MTVAAPSKPASHSQPSAYLRLISQVKDVHLLGSSASILGWDQETMMPPGGLEHRARQMAMLAKLTHQMATEPRIDDLLGECESDPALMRDPLSVEAVNVRELRRSYDRRTKLPAALVEEEALLSSRAKHEWAEARKASDFKRFQPWLEKIVALLRQKAACYGHASDGEPWDALAEDYEPGCTAKQVEAVFTPLRKRLQALLDALLGSRTRPSNAFNEFAIPIPRQEQFVTFVAAQIGFDFNRGRLDRSTHPFCGGSHCGDVRLTTHYTETCVNDALGSTMHECGHGIYEQGLLEQHIGTPMGDAVSLGIHESQSRLWENQVGRGKAFWTWAHPRLPEFLGDAVKRFSFQEIYEAANIVEPGFIRVEADEATYNMHIMIRFEIERALMQGDLRVSDVPAAWNARYKAYLNLVVPDDRRGCLQDIHWSQASMGYFPTYTLGNLHSAQFFHAACKAMPDLERQFARGEFTDLRAWLNTNIHAHGQRHRAAQLCEVVTGKPLSADHLMDHLEGKLKPIYGL
jgi:carboxypeptidase Taq